MIKVAYLTLSGSEESSCFFGFCCDRCRTTFIKWYEEKHQGNSCREDVYYTPSEWVNQCYSCDQCGKLFYDTQRDASEAYSKEKVTVEPEYPEYEEVVNRICELREIRVRVGDEGPWTVCLGKKFKDILFEKIGKGRTLGAFILSMEGVRDLRIDQVMNANAIRLLKEIPE